MHPGIAKEEKNDKMKKNGNDSGLCRKLLQFLILMRLKKKDYMHKERKEEILSAETKIPLNERCNGK
jgi:hypothetical protein